MTTPIPTRQEARASLAEATARAARIHRADTPPVASLLAQAAMMLAAGAVLGLLPRSTGQATLLLLIGCLGLAGMLTALARLRASSRAGNRWFNATTIISSLWTSFVIATSVSLHWWSRSQPWHFTVSMAAMALPQLIAATLIRRRGVR